MSNLHRENVSRTSQNSSTRRVTQPRVPTSTRMARLRGGRFPGQSRTVSSRQRNVVFPPNMDVDMVLTYISGGRTYTCCFNISLIQGLG